MSSQLNVGAAVMDPPSDPPRGPEIPQNYGVTRLVLMPRDAEWVYSYWELAPDAWDRAEDAFRPSIWSARSAALRFRVADKRRREHFLVGVSLDEREKYVPCPFHGGKVVAELGLNLPNGTFAPLAASNEIILPSGRAYDPATEEQAGPTLWSRRGEVFGFPPGAHPESEPMEQVLSRHRRLLQSGSSWPFSGARLI